MVEQPRSDDRGFLWAPGETVGFSEEPFPDDDRVEGDGEDEDQGDAGPHAAPGFVFERKDGGLRGGSGIVAVIEGPLADGAGDQELGIEGAYREGLGEVGEAAAVIEADHAGVDGIIGGAGERIGRGALVAADRAGEGGPVFIYGRRICRVKIAGGR